MASNPRKRSLVSPEILPSVDQPKAQGVAASDRTAAGAGISGGRNWTADQLLGITTTGKSLLVSAAAGSGKTAVLSARCVYLICDAPEPCEVDELLVVTFTEAAALEMKKRIADALRERAESNPDDRIARQIALVDQAQVSTLHAFCMRMLRQHFHLVGVDPAFRTMDADEAHLLRREIGRELLRERYELDVSGDFQSLIDAYCDGDDDRILQQILHVHDLLTSVVDPQAWLKRSQERIAHAKSGRLEESEMGQELAKLIGHGLSAMRRRCEQAIKQITQLGFAKYAGYTADLGATLRYWSDALETGGVDALSEVINDAKLPALPRESGDAADREMAKAAVDSVRDEMKAGAWRDMLRFTAAQWQQGLAAIEPHSRTFVDLVTQFGGRYKAAKTASRAIDFSDLERFALEILRDSEQSAVAPSAAARGYHRRFAHVLVDEYQDINEVQDTILHLLSRECVTDERKTIPNLFCVGDVKQSIYRFRLAEPARFLARQERFGSENCYGQLIHLQDNFRSRAPLLEAINGVFDRLMTAEAAEINYDKTHRLRAGRQFPDAKSANCFVGSPIELHLLPSKRGAGTEETETTDPDAGEPDDLDRSEREAVQIARRIRQIIGADGTIPMSVIHAGKAGDEPRPARFSDIVILLRSMKKKADKFSSILRRHGIAVHSESGSGYFESVEVRDMLALLSCLDNLRQDIPLAAVLRSPIAQLADPENALAAVRIAYLESEEPPTFHEAVLRYAAEREDDLAHVLREFLEKISQWRTAARRRPLADVIWQIFQQTGYLAFVAGLENGEQRAANLMYLYERAGQFGGFQRQGLSLFMRFLEDLEDESDLGHPSIVTEAQDAVRIMSIHRSKGLEFPIVVIPDLGKAINMGDCRGHILADRAAGLGMSVVDYQKRCRYPSLSLVLVRENLRRQTMAEELRVLYVAMTRAKEHLILVGTCGEKAPARWSNLWAGHQGPLPTHVVLDASSMLDWIGPVASATVDLFRIIEHTSDETQGETGPLAKTLALTPLQRSLAALQPLAEEPPETAAATEAIGRVSFRYPFKLFSNLPAAQSVTSRKATAGSIASLRTAKGAESLSLPKFLRETNDPSAVDRGTATHIVLEHLNFVGPCDSADVAEQIESLVARKSLSPTQAALVDIDAIQWFLSSPVGLLIRQNAGHIRREVPVNFPYLQPADASLAVAPDPMDRTMVRGRIDLLIPTPGGAVIVDYKTDNVREENVNYRAADYRLQMQAYRDAIARITGQPPTAVYLAFLMPRVLWKE